jgi:hypothetical protein
MYVDIEAFCWLSKINIGLTGFFEETEVWFGEEACLNLRLLLCVDWGHKGCQIFRGTTYQNGKNVPNGHEIYQMTVK